jgi:hypothetical protein
MTKKEMVYFLFGSIVSADNSYYTENEKQDMINRFNIETKDLHLKEKILNWEYILEPMQNKNHKEKYIKLFRDAQN